MECASALVPVQSSRPKAVERCQEAEFPDVCVPSRASEFGGCVTEGARREQGLLPRRPSERHRVEPSGVVA